MTSKLLSASSRASLEKTCQAHEANLAAVLPYLATRGITPQTAAMCRLGSGLDDHGNNRLSIPYVTADGSVVDIRYRSLSADGPKYLSRPHSKVRLYGVTALLSKSPVMFLTEGEIDCITLGQLGIPAVGVPGASSWQSHWRRLFDDFDTVVAVCDGDQAGKDFGKRVTERIDSAVTVQLPDGQDINSIYTELGEQALRERLVW